MRINVTVSDGEEQYKVNIFDYSFYLEQERYKKIPLGTVRMINGVLFYVKNEYQYKEDRFIYFVRNKYTYHWYPVDPSPENLKNIRKKFKS